MKYQGTKQCSLGESKSRGTTQAVGTYGKCQILAKRSVFGGETCRRKACGTTQDDIQGAHGSARKDERGHEEDMASDASNGR